MPSGIWFLAGGAVAIINAVTRRRAVASIPAATRTRSLVLVVVGVFLRLGLIAGLLGLALQRGIVPGLLAFGGLWVTRGLILVCFGLGWFGTLERVPASGDDSG